MDRSVDGSSARTAAEGIVKRLRRAGHEALFVGGCVRDLLRGMEPADYDIATSARPEQVQALFQRTVPVGAAYGVLLVVEGGRPYEVATFRSERGYDDGRRPSQVRFAAAEEDVRRRDFTINGLLMDPATGDIVDHVGGRADLDRRMIRTIGDPERRFAEDHLRMLRAVRFAAALAFAIDPAVLEAIRRQAAAVRRISSERIREELTKIWTGSAARRGMELLSETGLLAELLPEVQLLRGVAQPAAFHPEGDVWEHTLRMLDRLTPDAEGRGDERLAWAAVLHDVGKAVTRTEDASGVHFYNHVRKGGEIADAILRRYKFPVLERDAILALIREHMTFMNVREMRPNRLKRFLRIPDFSLHLELHRLDCLASHGLLDSHTYCLEKIAELTEEDLHPPRLLSGDDLIAMGLPPGPHFRTIFRAVEDGQLNREIGTAEEARRFVTSRFLAPEKIKN